MNLDLFNNVLNRVKENDVIQNLSKDISKYLENAKNSTEKAITKTKGLKEEDCLYQVVEMAEEGAYLKNANNNRVYEEKDLPKELLDKIGNDTILRYKNGEYIIEEEMTQKFFDDLVGIKEYREMQDNFTKESNILENSPDTIYKIEKKQDDYSILSYGEKNTLKVPNELIPFFANKGEELYYKNGKFNRNIN